MKKKIIVSALTLMAGFGLVGSVTSTIAWYQYSTKTTGGVKGNLQMRIKQDGQAADEGWSTKITKEQMATFLGAKDIVPITSGSRDIRDPLPSKLYCNPICGYAAQSSWKEAVAANYIQIPLELRYHVVNASGEANLAKDIYLSDLYLAKDATSAVDGDLSSAIRFHINNATQSENRLVSQNGGSIVTHGNLDLDGDNELDKSYTKKSDKYGFTNGEGTLIDYGFVQDDPFQNKQSSFSATTSSANGILADLKTGTNKTTNTKLGTTLTDDDAFLNFNITIWVEGWQPLPEGANAKTIWDAETFINSKFDVGFEFEADIQQSKTNTIDYLLTKPRALMHVALRVEIIYNEKEGAYEKV